MNQDDAGHTLSGKCFILAAAAVDDRGEHREGEDRIIS